MAGLTFCNKCGSVVILKKNDKDESQSWCSKCGFLTDQTIDRQSYIISEKKDLTKKKTMILDRAKQRKELEKKHGKRTRGAACPHCKGLYLTKNRIIRHGDSPGRTFFYCLICSNVFRRPIYINPQESEKSEK